MANKVKNGYSNNCLVKEIGGVKIYLYKSWDLVHGKGWFAHSVFFDFTVGFGFHRSNKFSAVREAMLK